MVHTVYDVHIVNNDVHVCSSDVHIVCDCVHIVWDHVQVVYYMMHVKGDTLFSTTFMVYMQHLQCTLF